MVLRDAIMQSSGCVAQANGSNKSLPFLQFLDQTLKLTYEEGIQMLKVQTAADSCIIEACFGVS